MLRASIQKGPSSVSMTQECESRKSLPRQIGTASRHEDSGELVKQIDRLLFVIAIAIVVTTARSQSNNPYASWSEQSRNLRAHPIEAVLPRHENA